MKKFTTFELIGISLSIFMLGLSAGHFIANREKTAMLIKHYHEKSELVKQLQECRGEAGDDIEVWDCVGE